MRITAQHARIAAVVLALAASGIFLVVPVSPTNNEPAELLISAGPRAAIFLLAPPVLAAAPLVVGPSRVRRIVTSAAAALLAATALLELLVVGWLYLPSALALVAAAVLRDHPSDAT